MAPQVQAFQLTRPGIGTRTVCPAVGEVVVLGRHLDCHVRLDGRKVSRRHVQLTRQAPAQYLVEDLGSHNGTFVNGQRVQSAVVRPGDVVMIGEWAGRVQYVKSADPAAHAAHTAPHTLPASAGSGLAAAASAAVSSLPAGLSRAVSSGLFDDVTERKDTPLAQPAVRVFRAEAAPASAGEPEVPRVGAPADRTRVMDMQRVWEWQELSPGPRETPEAMRAKPMSENPIVRRLTQTELALKSAGIADLAEMDAARTPLSESNPVLDALALRLVYRVAEALGGQRSVDNLLDEVAQSLQTMARAKAVAVLLPGEAGDLEPRVVRNSRTDERVEISRTIIEHAVRDRAAITTEDAGADARFAAGESVLRFDLKAVLVVPLISGDDVAGAVYLTRDLPFTDGERDLVAALAHLVASGLERAVLAEKVEREERTRRALERFHAPDVVRRLMMQAERPRTDGLFIESLTATVLFCDLSGFTTFCETRAPEEVGLLLNTYLGAMTEIVFAHGGTVDKYIGDAIMCIFGAPFSAPDDAERAVRCALHMRTRFEAMVAAGEVAGASVGPDGRPSEGFQVHIGVNTGPVVAGTVGSAKRMEYTALGDTVNIAARLEGVAGPGQIVIGPNTAAVVDHAMELRSLGAVGLKGKRGDLEVFEVLGEKGDLAAPGIPGTIVPSEPTL